jgi:hypothetical protein
MAEQGWFHKLSASLEPRVPKLRAKTVRAEGGDEHTRSTASKGAKVNEEATPLSQAVVSLADNRRQLRWACHIDRKVCDWRRNVGRSCQSVNVGQLSARSTAPAREAGEKSYLKLRAVFAKQAALKNMNGQAHCVMRRT